MQLTYLDFVDPPASSDREYVERMILVLDHSGSMDKTDWKPSRLRGAIAAADALIDVKARRHPDDEVGIVTFSSNAVIIHQPVPVRSGEASLKRALRSIAAEGFTNITAGLAEAYKHLSEKQSDDQLGRGRFDPGTWVGRLLGTSPSGATLHHEAHDSTVRRVVLLTDGEHNCGRSPQPLAAKLKARGILIDCVGIGGSPNEVDEKCLRAIASQNGDGSVRYCFIGDKAALIKKFEQLANRIRPAG